MTDLSPAMRRMGEAIAADIVASFGYLDESDFLRALRKIVSAGGFSQEVTAFIAETALSRREFMLQVETLGEA